MRFIDKGREPNKLTDFRRKNRKTPQNLRYEALDAKIKQALHDQMLREQGAICAYTMEAIGRSDAADHHIEHIPPQCADEANELDYRNMVLCAPGNLDLAQADWGANKKGGARVDDNNFVSPLNRNCETRLKFGANGDVRSANPEETAAGDTIELLNLNRRRLLDARSALIREYGLGAETRKPLTTSQAESLASEIMRLDAHGWARPYCVAIKQVAERYARQRKARAARRLQAKEA